jgi:hypothetical protein
LTATFTAIIRLTIITLDLVCLKLTGLIVFVFLALVLPIKELKMKFKNVGFKFFSFPCYWQLWCDYDEHDLFGTRSDRAWVFGDQDISKCFN